MAKKGIHRAPDTEWKSGEHPSPQTEFKRGLVPWNKGLKGVYKQTPEAREKARLSHIGKRYNNGKHWVTKTCQRCGKSFEVKRGEGKNRIYCSLECARSDRKSNGFIRKDGYKMVRLNRKSILEHRLIAEQMLGRSLKQSEVVHHNNGNKLDNRRENLTVMSQACHRALVDYLANLWIGEHLDLVDKVTRGFTITFSSGG